MLDADGGLFILPNGQPMVFMLKRAANTEKIKSLIISGGGKHTSQPSKNTILLASPGMIVTSKDFIHSQYIVDCVNLKKRLQMKAYAVEPYIPVPELPPAPSTHPTSTSRHNNRARKPFTISESAAIWNYIVSNKLENQIHKRSIWLNMEAAKLTSHSAESMRSHFRQVLAAQLPSERTNLSGSSSRSRRREFTEQDDRAIMDHILQNKCFSLLSSRKFWQDLERQKLTVHSGESMRSRFRRCLLNRILSELQNVVTGAEYEEAADTLLRLGPHIATHSAQSSQNYTDDYTIEETTLSESEATFSSPSILPRGIVPADTAVQISKPTFPQNGLLLHSTPQKISRAETSVRTTAINEMTIQAGSSSPSPIRTDDFVATQTQRNPNTNQSDSIPDFASQLMQSSDLIKTPLQAYLLVSMTNGSVTEAINFLQTGRRRPDLPPNETPPLWTPDADAQLASCDPDVLRQLIRRYGSDEVCQRIAYLADA